MIDSIIRFSIRHPVTVIAASLVLGLLGLRAAWTTPVDAIPDLSENQAIVFTEWPGRGPREIEDQITEPLASGLRGLPGVKVVRGSSEVGFSMISLIFDDALDVEIGRRAVTERLAVLRARLPAGVNPKLGPDAAATGQIFWYTIEGGGLDLGELRRIQDHQVRPRLASLEGVADVAGVGGFPTEYLITPEPGVLERMGLGLEDLVRAVARSNAVAGGHVAAVANAEHVIRATARLGTDPRASQNDPTPDRVIHDLEQSIVPLPGGGWARLEELARVERAPGFRRGALEKDGSEVVGGVVLLARGSNPIEVIRAVKNAIRDLGPGLPRGVRIIPFYDRTPLIEGAIGTVTRALLEAMISASLCVFVLLLHLRAALAASAALPLAALAAMLFISILSRLNIIHVETTASSLAGIAISIGVLVDSSVVLIENVMHCLRSHLGDRPATSAMSEQVEAACLAVGRPIVASAAVMVLSFLPVFALGGVEGRMFQPLALTKSLAVIGATFLAITLVPALCGILIRGRIRDEDSNPLVRAVVEVYRPVLSFFLDRPAGAAWIVLATLLVGAQALGNRAALLALLAAAIVITAALAQRRAWAVAGPGTLVLVVLASRSFIPPLQHETMTPLDEGMVMDMPITVPRATVAETVDEMKARNMIMCRFPEVDMVVGKAGRADTPTDPAPIDMIETMVAFRPREFWPRRKLAWSDARRQCAAVLDALERAGVVEPPTGGRGELIHRTCERAMVHFDAASREYAYHRYQEILSSVGGVSPTSVHPGNAAEAQAVPAWRKGVEEVEAELANRAAPLFTRLVIDDYCEHMKIRDASVAAYRDRLARVRARGLAAAVAPHRVTPGSGRHHHGSSGGNPILEPAPLLEAIRQPLVRSFARGLLLWKADRRGLTSYGGELDQAVATPGWINVWTMPIQNRVDMLATGVNAPIGVRVLGRDLERVVQASEEVARVLKELPGVGEVIADPIRGKPELEIRLDRQRATALGVDAASFVSTIEIGLGGRQAAAVRQDRAAVPIVVRLSRSWRDNEETLADLPIPAVPEPASIAPPDQPTQPRFVPLSQVATITRTSGPASIKSERGLLRNYVRITPRDVDPLVLVDQARAQIDRKAHLPEGVFLEWTGEFEHLAHARQSMITIAPVVLALILLVLYSIYRDLADSLLVMASIPGALAGGLLFQQFLGVKLSVTVGIGYFACFGMAASTGVIMMVYLRQALARAGSLEQLSLEGLRQAVLEGAVHRLRPKLLTEATIVLGLVPMLWAEGAASELIRPMSAPVLGGILVADEVIDLFLPVFFFWIRARRWQKLQARPFKPPSPGQTPATLPAIIK